MEKDSNIACSTDVCIKLEVFDDGNRSSRMHQP